MKWFKWRPKQPEVARCWKCRREIQPGEASASLIQNGCAYYFCGEHPDDADDVPFY